MASFTPYYVAGRFNLPYCRDVPSGLIPRQPVTAQPCGLRLCGPQYSYAVLFRVAGTTGPSSLPYRLLRYQRTTAYATPDARVALRVHHGSHFLLDRSQAGVTAFTFYVAVPCTPVTLANKRPVRGPGWRG